MIRMSRALLPTRRRPGGLAALIGASATLLLLAIACIAATAPPRATDMIVQAVAGDAAQRDAAATAAIALLHATRGVKAVRRVDPAELARMAGPLPLNAAPLPALIDATLTAGADRGAVQQALAPLENITVQPATPPRSQTSLHRLAQLAALIAGAAMAGSAIGAVRGWLTVRSDTIDLLRALGAEDHGIARLFAQDAAVDTGTGVAAGAAVAMTALSWAGLLGWGQAGAMIASGIGGGLLTIAAAYGMAMIALRRRA